MTTASAASHSGVSELFIAAFKRQQVDMTQYMKCMELLDDRSQTYARMEATRTSR